MAAIPLKHDDVYYPESDGQPMAETDLHPEVMTDLINGLKRRYAHAPDVYISGNLFCYEVQGDPRSSFSPDVFLVKGVPKERRRTYKIWEEGEVPCFVIEVTSAKTRGEDPGRLPVQPDHRTDPGRRRAETPAGRRRHRRGAPLG